MALMSKRAVLAIAALAAAAAGAPAEAARDPYAFRIEKTPEEGPLDPAVERRYTSAWQACSDRTEAPNDRAQCFLAEYGRQDETLNRTWRTTLSATPRARRPLLLRSQRRWIAERDPFCHRFVNGMSGSLAGIAFQDCRVELTIRRTMWLEGLSRT